MIAKLWAEQIIAGNKTFAQVPRKLREKVGELLIVGGYEELTTE